MSFAVAAIVHLIVRIASAFYQPVLDCDETYNYYEPLHRLLYGHGFQTWEYSPSYALRSYAYLWLYAAPSWLLSCVTEISPATSFYCTRLAIALVTAYAERWLTRIVALSQTGQLSKAGSASGAAARLLLLLTAAPGMFSAGVAFLPSSFAMVAVMMAQVVRVKSSSLQCVLYLALGGLLGWPFSIAIAIPYVVGRLLGSPGMIRKNIVRLLFEAAVAAFLVGLPILVIDSWHYGRHTFPPANIVAYNVLENKSHLYGVESAGYYAKNLVLNFNLQAVLAPVGLVLAFATRFQATPALRMIKPFIIGCVLFTIAMWLQSHKEERFLYVVYPHVVILAFTALESLSGLAERLRSKKSKGGNTSLKFAGDMVKALVVVIYIGIVLMGASRILAVFRNYRAPMSVDVASKLEQLERESGWSRLHDKVKTVCLDSEWHRTAGHFLMPLNTRLAFLQGSSSVHMPAHYLANISLPEATRKDGGRFNDKNELEKSHFVSHDACNFFVGIHAYPDSVKLSCQLLINNDKSRGIGRLLWIPAPLQEKLDFEKLHFREYCFSARLERDNRP